MVSGILPVLALSLRHRGPLTLLTAKLVAELAKEREFSAAFSPDQTTSPPPKLFGPQRPSAKASATRAWSPPCCRC